VLEDAGDVIPRITSSVEQFGQAEEFRGLHAVAVLVCPLRTEEPDTACSRAISLPSVTAVLTREVRAVERAPGTLTGLRLVAGRHGLLLGIERAPEMLLRGYAM
jgi:hypothetical protein